jgi:glycosyltransferase involved in cell wall biosynthesis
LNRTNAIGIVRLAGDGPQAQELGMRARQLKLGAAWQLIGSYSDANTRSLFMRSLDVFVLPSLAEGTPNAIIEAMAHGLPVIATEVGGIPDLVTSETGVLVRAGDPEMLAQAMLRLAIDSDLRERMGRAARARYLSLFSPAAVLPILENTYLRILRSTEARAIDSAATTLLHPWDEIASEI